MNLSNVLCSLSQDYTEFLYYVSIHLSVTLLAVVQVCFSCMHLFCALDLFLVQMFQTSLIIT